MTRHISHGHLRTVSIYPWYSFASNTFFWMPVFFLFFLSKLSFEDVLRLEAIYYAAVVLLEVPSGYFSDRMGRRLTLLISAASFCFSYALFCVSTGFLSLALAQVLLAVGISFNSGTDTSLHYDSLAALGRESEYGDREARVSHLSFLAGAIGALLGGLAGAIELRLAYALSFLSSIIALILVTQMAEPSILEKKLMPASGFIKQLKAIFGHFRNRMLGAILAYYILMTVLNHVPYEFYQPYLDQVLNGAADAIRSTPMIAGFHMAAAMLIASWVAKRSMKMKNKVGLKLVLLTAALIQTILIISMGVIVSWVIAGLIVLRSVPRALMTAPINAAVAPLVPQHQRATYFSVQSLAGRLTFSVVLIIFSMAGKVTSGNPMNVSLWIAGAIGLLGSMAWGMIRLRDGSK